MQRLTTFCTVDCYRAQNFKWPSEQTASFSGFPAAASRPYVTKHDVRYAASGP